ncbi:MAG TPA: Z1 domain-containing protein [Thermoanaerobaculia bacterium]|nr:Z1 domain-containing protein [Thermoanaerobaculia bacterium]
MDFQELLKKKAEPHRYQARLDALAGKIDTASIQATVEAAAGNLNSGKRSFVIYGEPQSGKTEMMVCLTARLLDEGRDVIVVLVNDSVRLLRQNLRRFRESGLNPAPKSHDEVLDASIDVGSGKWVVFCKKNKDDLPKLIEKLAKVAQKVVIDDEADYASPNAKVNDGERTKINELVDELLGSDGAYIGVTATPARLSLNKTFDNDAASWVLFKPHSSYRGQDYFFPVSAKAPSFRLNVLRDDKPENLRDALLSFLVSTAILNLEGSTANYSMLIHTSGKRVDHSEDYKQVLATLEILQKPETHAEAEAYYQRLAEIANERYPGRSDAVQEYVLQNIGQAAVTVINSDPGKKFAANDDSASPSAKFTFIIGGNIVSRGVTFDNLLSMFFTRGVKGRMQQDTYIQRARMFGARDEALVDNFELSIPEKLYRDWQTCFVLHKLSLESIKSGNPSPVWVESDSVRVTSSSSVNSDVWASRGEMSFDLFDYNDDVQAIVDSSLEGLAKVERLAELLGEKAFPAYLVTFMKRFRRSGDGSIAVHRSKEVRFKDADIANIRRAKGFIGQSDLEPNRFRSAIHHIKIYFNPAGRARVFYKYNGTEGIRFQLELAEEKTAPPSGLTTSAVVPHGDSSGSAANAASVN